MGETPMSNGGCCLPSDGRNFHDYFQNSSSQLAKIGES